MHKMQEAKSVTGGSVSGMARRLDLSSSRDKRSLSDRFEPRKGTALEAISTLKNVVWSADHDLSTSDRVVLEALLWYSDEQRETFISVAKMALKTALSEPTVRRCIARLRARGIVSSRIERTSTGRRNRYTVDLVPLGGAPAHEGSAHDGRTGPVTMITPPPLSPPSDRDHLIDPPTPPIPEPVAPRGETLAPAGGYEASADVERVLEHFMAVLHPGSTGPTVTPDRRRLVEARLREFGVQPLLDAVDGAALSRWHRESDIGFRADIVFRSADTIEQLSRLARARRCQKPAISAAKPPPSPSPYRPRGFVSPAGVAFGLELEKMFSEKLEKSA